MRGDFQARFCERLGVKFPLSTRSQTRSTQFDQTNENCARIKVSGFLRKKNETEFELEIEIEKATSELITLADLQNVRKKSEFRICPKPVLCIENLANRKVSAE